MNNLKEKSISILCAFGKYGVGKSLTLGMYDFAVPKELINFEDKKLSIETKHKQNN